MVRGSKNFKRGYDGFAINARGASCGISTIWNGATFALVQTLSNKH